MIIAFAGPDGSGKTTGAKQLRQAFRERGINAWHLDIPRFTAVPVVNRVISCLIALSRYRRPGAKKGYQSVLLVLGVLTFGVPFTWLVLALFGWRTLIVEHHPKIDLVPYGTIYGGRFGGIVAGWIAQLFPKPTYVIFLDTDPALAARRVRERMGTIAPHETQEQLELLQELIRQRIEDLEIPGFPGGAVKELAERRG